MATCKICQTCNTQLLQCYKHSTNIKFINNYLHKVIIILLQIDCPFKINLGIYRVKMKNKNPGKTSLDSKNKNIYLNTKYAKYPYPIPRYPITGLKG